jgi:hypothetical protein
MLLTAMDSIVRDEALAAWVGLDEGHYACTERGADCVAKAALAKAALAKAALAKAEVSNGVAAHPATAYTL